MEHVSISSSVPLINLYLLNIGQAIVVIFLAADFLKRDKKLDTNEVLYTRSMSNFEYVIGKTLGNSPPVSWPRSDHPFNRAAYIISFQKV